MEKIVNTKSCKNCSREYYITDWDQEFYKKFDVPEPTLCPDCRLQRRYAWRNEWYMFHRSCDFCDKEIISIYPENARFPVYCKECWWGDKWDPLSYGQDYDFSRPFFEQFNELLTRTPKMGMIHYHTENSDYNSVLALSKNTYMSPGSYYLEDCYYVRKSQYCTDCVNSNHIDHCELVAYSVNCEECYSSHHLVNCRNITDSAYIMDSYSLKNCFLCAGINNKRYHILNEPHTKEEYEQKIAHYRKKPPKEILKEFNHFSKQIPRRYQQQLNCESSSGNYIQNCKNATNCYDCFRAEDCKNCIECVDIKDCLDITNHDKEVELCYEICGGGDRTNRSLFGVYSVANTNCYYMHLPPYASDCFGCDGIHTRTTHCVLNKKYSKEEYDKMVPRIIEHMRSTGEWGEFFPAAISVHAYNCSNSQNYFPLTKEQVLKKGYQWYEEKKQHQKTEADFPDAINETPDSIANEILTCKTCSRNYKIIQQELELCRKIGVSLSKYCAECRYLELLKWKPPRKLFKRTCSKCGLDIESPYASEREEIIYCEKCYLNYLA